MSGIFYGRAWQQLVLIICLMLAFIPAAAQPGGRLYESRYNVLAIVFSPDGKLLAISRGTSDSQFVHGQIDVWDIPAKKLRRVIRGFDGPVWSIVFLADNRTLVSSSAEYRAAQLKGGPQKPKFYEEIKWWDVETGDLLRRQSNPTAEARAVTSAISADGNLLASVEYYTQLNTFITTTMDSSNPGDAVSAPVRFSMARTNFVDLNLLNARTGISRLASKNISRQSFVPLMGRFLSPRAVIAPLSAGVVFSPAGNLLAVGMPDQVKVFDPATGAQLRKLKDFDGRLSALEFSGEGQLLAVASVDAKIKREHDFITTFYKSELNFYDAATGKSFKKFARDGVIFDLSFAPAGGLLVGTNYFDQNMPRARIEQVDAQTGKASRVLDKSGAMRSFTLAPDGQMLAYLDGRAVVLWDIKKQAAAFALNEVRDDENTPSAESRYVLDVNRILAISFSADGKTLAAGTEKNEIKLWEPRTGGFKGKLIGHEGTVFGVAVSPDGQKIISIGEDGSTRLWDARTSSQRGALAGGETLDAVALSPDAKRIAGGSENNIFLWNAETGKLEKSLPAVAPAALTAIAYSRDGRQLSTVRGDGQIELRNAETGVVEKSFALNAKITAAGFSADGRMLAAATDAGAISVWDTSSGSLLKNLRKDGAPVNALTFSADSRYLAGGGDDRKVVLWETSNWKSRDVLKGADLTITSLAFSPDGTQLAGGSGNLSVIIWNVATGELDRILR